MKKILLITCLFISTLFSQKILAQSYDGAGDSKLFMGLAQIGTNTGVEISYDMGSNDLISMGGKATLLFNDTSEENVSGFEKFFLNSDLSLFLRFHLSIPLNMSEKIDPYFGIDGSLKSIGAHAGVKYNFSETLGAYAQISRGFSKAFFGEQLQNKFANKTSLSAGITINL